MVEHLAGALQQVAASQVVVVPEHDVPAPLLRDAAEHELKVLHLAATSGLQQVAASLALVHVGVEQAVLAALSIRPLLPLSTHSVSWSVMVEHLAGMGAAVTVSGVAIHILSVLPPAPQIA